MSVSTSPIERTPRRGGFTMIELVIALFMTAIMAVIILTTFTAQNQLYRRHRDIGMMQQNLRLAMEIVTRDIALAGHGSGGEGLFFGQLPQSDPTAALQAIYAFDDMQGDGRDAIWVNYADPNHANWAIVDRSEGGSDATHYLCDTGELHVTTTSLLVTDPTANYDPTDPQFDQVVCFSNAANTGLGLSYLWNVAAGSGGGVILVDTNSALNDFTNKCQAGKALPEEMTCAPMVQIYYYIDRDGDGQGPGTPEMPYLMVSFDEMLENNDIPVAVGIEDLQFWYCDGFTNCAATNWAGAEILPAPYRWDRLGVVRVRMTARSTRYVEHGLPGASPVSLGSGAPVPGEPEYYHRRVAHQIVSIRNARNAYITRQGY